MSGGEKGGGAMKVYHAESKAAWTYLADNVTSVNKAGGLLTISWGNGLTPDMLVLELPDGVEPAEVCPEKEWREVKLPEGALLPGEEDATAEGEDSDGDEGEPISLS